MWLDTIYILRLPELIALPAVFPHKLMIFLLAQEEALALKKESKWQQVQPLPLVFSVLGNDFLYLLQVVPWCYSNTLGCHWMWLIVAKCCRKTPAPGWMCSACFLTNRHLESPMKQTASHGMWFLKEPGMLSRKILTLLVPLKCAFHEAWGSVGRTPKMALESYRLGFKYHVIISWSDVGI